MGCALASDPRCGALPGRWCPDPVRIRGSGSPPAAVPDREVRSLVLGWDASGGCSRLSGAAVGGWGGGVKWLFALGLPNKHGKEGSEGEAKHRTASHTQK